MKTIRIVISLFILISLCSFRLMDNPYPLFNVHVAPFGNCSGDQNGVRVEITWDGQVQVSGNTGSPYGNGWFNSGAPNGKTIYVKATYGSHFGYTCGVGQTDAGTNVYICLNDLNCCIPEFKNFNCNIGIDIY